MAEVKIGINMSTSPESVDVAILAQKVEELGFESLWVPEHTPVPVKTTTSNPDWPERRISEHYSRMMDPFVTLARASGVTHTLKLCTGICLVIEHNPLLLAKEVATLDYVSGGRFILGIGSGWLREETELMGGDFNHRWIQTREAILAMKEIWTKEEAEHHGKYYDFPAVRSHPKPVQKPHPPVILGGTAKNVFKRVVEWGDGWIPARLSPEEVKAGRKRLDELASAANRDPKSIEITASAQPPDPELVHRLEEAGANRVNIWLTTTEGQESLDQLERIAEAVLR